MGKRKKASKPMGPKKRETLATTFQCLFCNHENSVNVKLERKLGVGQLYCKVCAQTFQTTINYLSAAVDVYADWVDACDAVAKENATEAEKNSTSYREIDRSARPSGAGVTSQGEGDDFIVDDEMDGEGEFAED